MKKKEKERLSGLQQAARQLIEAMQGALADEQQFYRYVYGGKDRPPEQTVLEKADTKAIKEMAAALKEMTAVVRNLYDLPTPGETPPAPPRLRRRPRENTASSCWAEL